MLPKRRTEAKKEKSCCSVFSQIEFNCVNDLNSDITCKWHLS